jgi:hypothetical protein
VALLLLLAAAAARAAAAFPRLPPAPRARGSSGACGGGAGRLLPAAVAAAALPLLLRRRLSLSPPLVLVLLAARLLGARARMLQRARARAVDLARRGARLAVRPLVLYWEYLAPSIGPLKGTPEEDWKWERSKERFRLRHLPAALRHGVRLYKLSWTDPAKAAREYNELEDHEDEALFKWQMEYYEKQGIDEESLKELAERLRPVSRLTNENVDKGLEVADHGANIAKSALTVLKDALLALSDGFREGRDMELARIAKGEAVFPELSKFAPAELTKRVQESDVRKSVERILRARATGRREAEPVIQEVLDRAAARKAERVAAVADSKATAPSSEAGGGNNEPSFLQSLVAAFRGEKVAASLVLRDENGRRVDRRRDAGKSGARFMAKPPLAEAVGGGSAAVVAAVPADAPAAAATAAATTDAAATVAAAADAAPAAGADGEHKEDPGFFARLRLHMHGTDEQAAAVKRHMKKRRRRNARRALATAPTEAERLEWAAAHEEAAARAQLQAPALEDPHPSLSAANLARKAHDIMRDTVREMESKRGRPGPLLDELERAKLAVAGKPKLRIRKRNKREPPAGATPEDPAASAGSSSTEAGERGSR